MKKIIKFASISATGLLLSVSSLSYAQQPASLSDLLNAVEQDRVAQSQEHREREQRFQQQANNQQQIVDEVKARDAALMNTTGGTAGNVMGNIAVALPTVAIPGATSLSDLRASAFCRQIYRCRVLGHWGNTRLSRGPRRRCPQ